MELHIVYWILLAIGVVGIVLAVVFRLLPLRRVEDEAAPEGDADENEDESLLPPLSVVVYSHNSESELYTYLSDLLRQDYPDFEVIVVLDSEEKDLTKAAMRIEERFRGVHATFIPQTTYHLSRRKLALTLGVKAAGNDVVVTTSSNCHILSDRWLREIAAPFATADTGLVLGLCRPDFSLDTGAGKWYREFSDTLSAGMRISYAMKDSAFRGDIFNMAFRRRLFFEINGFSSSNFLHTGDDDIFVAEMAGICDVVPVVSRDSRLLYVPGTTVKKYYTVNKARYDFTSRYLPRLPFVLSGAGSAGSWLAIAGCAGAILTAAIESPLWTLLPALLLMLLWGAQIASYRRLASRLNNVRLWWAVVPFFLWLPIGNKLFRMRHRSLMKLTYTWIR